MTYNIIEKECVCCGIAYGIPDNLLQHRQKDGKPFYCPNGCSLYFHDSTSHQMANLKKELQEVKEELNNYKKENRKLKCDLLNFQNKKSKANWFAKIAKK